jgi:hypothetical protein
MFTSCSFTKNFKQSGIKGLGFNVDYYFYGFTQHLFQACLHLFKTCLLVKHAVSIQTRWAATPAIFLIDVAPSVHIDTLLAELIFFHVGVEQ